MHSASHERAWNVSMCTPSAHLQFDYLVREKIADGALIAKWRKPGYEILCSMLAIQKVWGCVGG